ncbi:MAG: glycosyltransferase [Candidatus Omnitrophota bacterium]
MKVFIIYASVGAGHHRTAKALYDYLKENRNNIADLRLVDALGHSNRIFRFLCTSGYSFLVSKTPILWRFFFWITNFRLLRIISRTIARICNWTNTQRFSSLLIRENPDYIICTHFLPTEIASNLKRLRKIQSKTITVITDYSVHPYWISWGVDNYIVATELTKKQLIREGVKEEKIKALGLPVSPQFFIDYKKETLLSKLGLKNDKFTVLMLTGSFGLGPIERIIDCLYGQVQLLVVCANNQKLYKRLSNKNLSDVRVYGYVDNIQELMTVSDIIITKPGGSTISEILMRELVPVFISPIPGQESGNVRVLMNYGVGILPGNVEEIKQAVLDFKKHPEKIKIVRESIRKIKNPDVLKEISDVIR